MITPITPSATQPLEEEEEQVGFGSHNIYAPNFSLFSALSFFPWQEFFVANGFDGEFPAIIYSDDRAEQLYQEVMGQLDLLAQDPSLHCTLGLTYQSDEQNMGQGLIGLLEVELTTKTLPDFLNFSGQSGTSILPYIFQTISLWVANEIRGFGEPFPLVSATSLAPLEISDAQGYRASYTLRLPSLPSEER